MTDLKKKEPISPIKEWGQNILLAYMVAFVAIFVLVIIALPAILVIAYHFYWGLLAYAVVVPLLFGTAMYYLTRDSGNV